MKIGFVLVAVADLLCGLFCANAAVGLWRAGEQSENAGLGLMAVVVFFIALLTFALAAWLLFLSSRPSHPKLRAGVAIVLGVIPPLAVAPFALDSWQRSTTRYTLACSNLHRNDPLRETAVFVTFHTYFSLLQPYIAHEPDTRYVVGEREFKLRCVRNGPCEVVGATEDELRAVVRTLPECPEPQR